MLMNNLDPEVAEWPDDLVVYRGSERAARSWEAFDAIVATLRRLDDDETLVVQSGKPVAVFRAHPRALRQQHPGAGAEGRRAACIRHPGIRPRVHPPAVLSGEGTVPLGRPLGRSGRHPCGRTSRCCRCSNRSIHAGMVVVADGTGEADAKLERVLTCNPGIGVVRHADAGCPEALALAAGAHIDMPMTMAGGVGR